MPPQMAFFSVLWQQLELALGVTGASVWGRALDSSGLLPRVTALRDSFLPVLFRQSVVYCHGGRVGFFQGDIRLLSDDMKALCPTICPVVPRLLNRMYNKVSLAGSLCLFGQRLEPQADFLHLQPQVLKVASSRIS